MGSISLPGALEFGHFVIAQIQYSAGKLMDHPG
jgi:hypothetical protein